MTVQFNNIPSNVRVPFAYFEFQGSAAVNPGDFVEPTLLIAQMFGPNAAAGLTQGSATPDALNQVFSAEQAAALYGPGSMAHHMVRCYRKTDSFGPLFVIGVDDNAGATQAAADLVFTFVAGGTAGENSTLFLYVAGELVRVAVADADDLATITLNAAAALNARTDLPVVADGTTVPGTLTITAKHAGEAGNCIDVRLNYLGTGAQQVTEANINVNVAQTSTLNPTAALLHSGDAIRLIGGATNPDITAAVAAMGDEPFDFVAVPWLTPAAQTELDLVLGEVNDRWDFTRQIYGHVVSGLCIDFDPGSTTAFDVASTFGGTRNNEHETVPAFYESPTPQWDWIAAWTANAAKYLAQDPARPLQTLPLDCVLPPAAGSEGRFLFAQRQSLLEGGIATWTLTGGVPRIERSITTYQTDAFGADDVTWLDINTPATLWRIVREMAFRMQSKFGRHKLVDDGVRFTGNVFAVTPGIIKAEIIALYAELEGRAWVENLETMAENLIVERSAADRNRVDVCFPPDLANQFRVLATLVKFQV